MRLLCWPVAAMQYLWLLLPSFGFGGLAYLQYRHIERAKLLARLRGTWGLKQQIRERDFEEIPLFRHSQADGDVIDDRTWADLTMDSVFARLDRTITLSGIQSLYQMLRTPRVDDLQVISKRDQSP